MNSSINNNVNLGGEQNITGLKYFLKNICRKLGIARDETPEQTVNTGYTIKDKNNNMLASFQGIKYATGTNRVQMEIFGKSGTARQMYVQETTDGAVTYQYGQQAGTNYIKIPKGASSYVLYCWGSGSKASGNSFTFPTPFSTTPIVMAVIGPVSGGSTDNLVVGETTTTFFKVIHNAPANDLYRNVSYIAIGTVNG